MKLEKIYEANENHWYIPSVEEVNWIIQNLINSQVTGSTGDEANRWKTANWNGANGMFLQMNQEYSKVTQGNIGSIIEFIGAYPKVTSEAEVDNPYFYGEEYNSGPQWRNTASKYDSLYKDSDSWRVIPCITINLSKNGNN